MTISDVAYRLLSYLVIALALIIFLSALYRRFFQ